MYWRFPSKTYFKTGCTTVALSDFAVLEQKKVKVIFSSFFSDNLHSFLKKVNSVLGHKNIETIEDKHLNKRITKDDLVILVVDYKNVAKVRAFIDDNVNTMIFISPLFSINHLSSLSNEKEILVADLALFTKNEKLMEDIKTTLWNVLTVSLQYKFLDQLLKKKGSIDVNTEFIFQIKNLWNVWFNSCECCLEKVFNTTLIASIELQQQTILFTNLNSYTIDKRIKTIKKLKSLKVADLSLDQLVILNLLGQAIDKKITSQKTYNEVVNKIEKLNLFEQ